MFRVRVGMKSHTEFMIHPRTPFIDYDLEFKLHYLKGLGPYDCLKVHTIKDTVCYIIEILRFLTGSELGLFCLTGCDEAKMEPLLLLSGNKSFPCLPFPGQTSPVSSSSPLPLLTPQSCGCDFLPYLRRSQGPLSAGRPVTGGCELGQ